LVYIAYISTEFDTESENRVPEQDLPSKFTSIKKPKSVKRL